MLADAAIPSAKSIDIDAKDPGWGQFTTAD